VWVYQGKAEAGRYKVGANVELVNDDTDQHQVGTVDAHGRAVFRIGPTPLNFQLSVVFKDGGRWARATGPHQRIPELPFHEKFDVDDYKPWLEQAEATSSWPKSSRLRIEAASLGASIGEPQLEHSDNAHWGLPEAQLVFKRRAYILGYDRITRIPRWVSYRVGHGADIRRPSSFRADSQVPRSFRSSTADYVGSGYDRGHLVSFRDVAFRGRDAEEVFTLSAVAPQTRSVNRGTWSELENLGRQLAKTGAIVHVTAGPAFVPHPGQDVVDIFTIGTSKVAIPTHFFRVMSVSAKDGYPEALYAFLVPNVPETKPRPWECQVSVNHIEHVTGLTLFPDMPRDAAAILKGLARTPDPLESMATHPDSQMDDHTESPPVPGR